MAILGFDFDANTVDPSASFPVYPADKYQVQIIKSEMVPTKDNTGQFLLLELEILSGDYAGGIILDRLNLINKNAQAQEIASRALSAICHAVDTKLVNDSEQLHFKPMTVELRVKPAGKDKQGVERDAQNEVKGYSAPAGNGPAQQTRQQPATRPAATTPAAATRPTPGATPGGGAAPPWRR